MQDFPGTCISHQEKEEKSRFFASTLKRGLFLNKCPFSSSLSYWENSQESMTAQVGIVFLVDASYPLASLALLADAAPIISLKVQCGLDWTYPRGIASPETSGVTRPQVTRCRRSACHPPP